MKRKMEKKLLIVAPHLDDEINLAGEITDQFFDNGYKIVALFVTNGDFYQRNTLERHKELRKSMTFLHISDYILLGYCDNYASPHLFNAIDKPLSIRDNSRTYGVNGKEEYCYEKRKKHSEFLRSNIQRDLTEAIDEQNAEYIICVDYDNHPDHRMTSILFDEAMRNLIVNREYYPIILKKFAYLGVWQGDADYFNPVAQPTTPINYFNTSIYNKCMPYSWEDRIAIKVNPNNYSLAFWQSPSFKALNKYKTQKGGAFFERIVNKDAVYWYRNTNNLALQAVVSASSGDANLVADFKLIDAINVTDESLNCNRFANCAWIPDAKDTSKSLTFEFSEKKIIRKIKIHQNFRGKGHINKLMLSYNGADFHVKCSEQDVQTVELDNVITEKLIIHILEYCGEAGIREIEIFEDNGSFPWNKTFLERDEPTVLKRSIMLSRCAELLYRIYIVYLKLKNRIMILIGGSHY